MGAFPVITPVARRNHDLSLTFIVAGDYSRSIPGSSLSIADRTTLRRFVFKDIGTVTIDNRLIVSIILEKMRKSTVK